jgi:response regulator RpfG family c-di-GMP phosphodiesterase
MMTEPRNMSEAQEQDVVHYLAATLNLKELRRRQTLVELQIAMAFRQRNTTALNNLRMKERHLQSAVLLQTGL